MAYIFKKTETIYYVVPDHEANDIQQAREVLENAKDLGTYHNPSMDEDLNQQPFTYHGETNGED